MIRKNAILDGNDVVRSNHLKRLAEGPSGIAHLVPSDDGTADARRKFNDEVAEIGRNNRKAATEPAKRGKRAGGGR